MTREEYESKRFVDDVVKRFHERTGKQPSTEEVIQVLREGRRKYFFPPHAKWGAYHIQKRSYIRFAIAEIIRRIGANPESDPIRILFEFYYSMDDMVASSENRITWQFAGAMRDAVRDILDLLD